MTDTDGDLRIVFNGESPNHRELRQRLEALGARFHSTTTPSLLALYRHDGASRRAVAGMFAFAIWNRQATRSRCPPIRIKPLYAPIRSHSARITGKACSGFC